MRVQNRQAPNVCHNYMVDHNIIKSMGAIVAPPSLPSLTLVVTTSLNKCSRPGGRVVVGLPEDLYAHPNKFTNVYKISVRR